MNKKITKEKVKNKPRKQKKNRNKKMNKKKKRLSCKFNYILCPKTEFYFTLPVLLF